jgi:hypothetical protein
VQSSGILGVKPTYYSLHAHGVITRACRLARAGLRQTHSWTLRAESAGDLQRHNMATLTLKGAWTYWMVAAEWAG